VQLSDKDQLRCILRVLGDPEREDFEYLEDEDAKSHCNNLSQGRSKIDFPQEFHRTDSDFASLLNAMLNFNPNSRASVETLLANPVFEAVRDPSLEVKCPI
jgi:serine/threonine protein kinase